MEVVRCIREQASRETGLLEEDLGEVRVLHGVWLSRKINVGGDSGGGDRIGGSCQGGKGGIGG